MTGRQFNQPATPGRTRPRQNHADGFTLIEILIVVVILGILAAIVVPQFSNASQTARENVLKDDLRYLRTQILVYKAQHRDVSPGHPGGDPTAAPTAADFLAQMTTPTDEFGNLSPTGKSTPVYKFGPYLTQMPPNPVSEEAGVAIIAGSGVPAAALGGAVGWLYRPTTSEIFPNTDAVDSHGIPFFSY